MSKGERSKLIQEKCSNIISELLRDDDNKYCVDCDAKSPRWASWNIGIFLCIRCAGIHRNLGVHISRVKSVNLDSWTPQQVACIQQMGNSRARAVYEANLPDNFRRPQTDSALEQFIRAKYEAKKYIAEEWIAPPMPNPKWDVEIEKSVKKKKENKMSHSKIELPALSALNSKASESPKPLPKAPGSKGSSSVAGALRRSTSSSSPTPASINQDLLELDSSLSNGPQTDGSDLFGDFLTASTSIQQTTSKGDEQPTDISTDEENFFNQKQPDVSSEKLTKDSILALYGKNVQSNMFGAMTGTNMVISAVSPGTLQGMSQQSLVGYPSSVPVRPPGSMNVLYVTQGPGTPNLNNSANVVTANIGGSVGSAPVSNGVNAAACLGGAAKALSNNLFAVGVPSGQLSSGNPFSQMQNQMVALNLSGSVPNAQLQQNPCVSVPPMAMSPSQMMSGMGFQTSAAFMGSVQQAAGTTTLSTNLWQ